MITTISLGNIRHHRELQIFFLVMKTFKAYSLSNFQIYDINIINCNPGAVHYISRTYVFYNWTFVFGNTRLRFWFLPETLIPENVTTQEELTHHQLCLWGEGTKGWFPSSSSFWWLLALLGLWPRLTNLSLCLHTAFSSVSVCSIPLPLFYKDTHVTLRAYPHNPEQPPTSRSLTQSHHLPCRLIVTGPTDREGALSGGGGHLSAYPTVERRQREDTVLTYVVDVG